MKTCKRRGLGQECGKGNEMNPVMSQNFLSIALPIMLTFIGTIWLASWSQNKRLDDIVVRLTRIEAGQKEHGEKIAMLDERSSPLARRG